jgi:hypothetical protein
MIVKRFGMTVEWEGCKPFEITGCKRDADLRRATFCPDHNFALSISESVHDIVRDIRRIFPLIGNERIWEDCLISADGSIGIALKSTRVIGSARGLEIVIGTGVGDCGEYTGDVCAGRANSWLLSCIGSGETHTTRDINDAKESFTTCAIDETINNSMSLQRLKMKGTYRPFTFEKKGRNLNGPRKPFSHNFKWFTYLSFHYHPEFG